MAKFNIGELVRIRKEWANNPKELTNTYRIVNVNDVTNRYYIEMVDCALPFVPQELVSEEVIEKA